MVAAGDTAPDFELPDQDGEPLVSPKTHDEQVLAVLADL
jgi:peroxiredoxin